MIEEALKKIGLTKNEIKIYLTTLQLGPSSVQEISKATKMHRQTVYNTVESLQKKKLMITAIKGKRKLYLCEDPEKILGNLSDVVKKIEEQRMEITKLLPELKSLHNSLENKPKVMYFEGIEGLKEIYMDTLKVGKTIYAFGAVHDKICKTMLRWLREDYVIKRAKKNILAKVILPFYPSKSTKYFIDRSKKVKREFKLVPADKFPFTIEINVYGNKVAIISYDVKEMFGVIIESKETAKTWKCIFDLAWEGASRY